jgi:hypothetical protein
MAVSGIKQMKNIEVPPVLGALLLNGQQQQRHLVPAGSIEATEETLFDVSLEATGAKPAEDILGAEVLLKAEVGELHLPLRRLYKQAGGVEEIAEEALGILAGQAAEAPLPPLAEQGLDLGQ